MYNGRLLIPAVTRKDTGAYECFTPDGQVKRVHLIVKSQLDIERNLSEIEMKKVSAEGEEDGEMSDERGDEYVQSTANDRQEQQKQQRYCKFLFFCINELDEHLIILFANQVCGLEEATCRNGQCIPRDGLCDGRKDCEDGTDENNCGGADSSGKKN